MRRRINITVGLLGTWTLIAGLALFESTAAHCSELILSKPRPALLCSAEKIFYQNGRITGKLKFWNNKPWEHTLIAYMDDLFLYSVQTMVYHNDKVNLVSRELFKRSGPGRGEDQKIETWYYHFDKDRPNTLRQIDTYWPDTTLVRERQMFDEQGGLKAAALFEYGPDAQDHLSGDGESIAALTRMTLLDDEGAIVADYRETTDVDLNALYSRHPLLQEEITRRIRISKDPSRIPILIMDGGIDISHPELAYKLWRNPLEAPNGKDDDGNGLVDDIFGISDNPRLAQPVHDLRLPRYGLPTFSHGTIVASIAAQGREDVAIMSASELTAHNSSQILPRIQRLIASHGVRFTNMSFVFDKQLLGYDSGAQRPHQIEQLIQNTPRTLHVAAAGNGTPINGRGFNVDTYRQAGDLVPAMLAHDNILVVGALDTSRLHLPDYPSYRMAAFSNTGEVSVDILAPGTRMCGAQMGGGTVCDDGTSFAAPYVLNHGVLNVARANPDLDIYQIKEILMKTAYVPDLEHPFPVRSGGILHPRRAVTVARRLAEFPSDAVETAVLAVRKKEVHPIPGERRDAEYLDKLQSFWTRRSNDSTTIWYSQADQAPP
jgi:hypothetical protein